MKINFKKLVVEHTNSRCSDCTVKCSSVLKNCSEECLEQISSFKNVTAFSKGYQIITQGNSSQRIYFIKTGKIKIYKSGNDGRELIIRFAKAGDIIGFGNPDKENENEVSAKAIDDTVLCYLDHKIFLKLVRRYPEFAWQLLQYYKCELQNAETKSIKLAQLSVTGKVADTLLNMLEVYGSNKKNNSLNLTLSRQDIASFAGTTKEQVSKVLSEFHDHGFIYTKGKRIDMLNPDALRVLSRV